MIEFVKKLARRLGLGRALWRFWSLPLSRLRRLRLPAANQILDVQGFRLEVLSPRNNRIGEALFRRGVWEPNVTEFVKTLLKPGMTVVDVGADIGYYSLHFARGVGPAGQVFAFEPIPQARDLLKRNLTRNQFQQVRVYDCALGSREGEVFLKNPLQESRIDWNAASAGPDLLPIPVRRFDAIADRIGLDRLDLVKIDIEGSEHDALLGMEKSLEMFRPALIVEIHRSLLHLFNTSEPELLEFLSKKGYRKQLIEGSEDSSENATYSFMPAGAS